MDHCLFQDGIIDLAYEQLGDDEVSRRLRDVQDKAAIKRLSYEIKVVCGDAHCRIYLGRNNLTKIPEELWLFENLDM